jgi:hypothetical protein
MICSKWTLAIDPGATGSAALFCGTALYAVLAFGLKANKNSWEGKLADWCYLHKPDVIVMEDVHAFGSDARNRAFAFGGNKQKVLSALKFAGRKVDKFYDPKKWQRLCGLPHNHHIRDKAERRKENRACQKALAIRLYPSLLAVPGDVFASVCIGWAALQDTVTSCTPGF